ncbi:TPA: hypothetical protein P2K97_004097 [Aeromonas salmonicida]|nr:hypothetical protein [Aeromonas salmonicida]EKP0241584.1 hypothetical protein [Aeromonas salmonicida]EKP0245713.1 hypothetical protein [Aeromonas salmonicida]EKP0254324.1 hypothetical protein [Aeromonas salmonicida]EKP0258450.1 hypothetical protein [Aeromonas salmonicida]EKP0267119.1 hypothetical protein [Aeromonas salmonicida]
MWLLDSSLKNTFKSPAPHHHPEFDFDEAVLEHGVALLESWLLSRLGT